MATQLYAADGLVRLGLPLPVYAALARSIESQFPAQDHGQHVFVATDEASKFTLQQPEAPHQFTNLGGSAFTTQAERLFHEIHHAVVNPATKVGSDVTTNQTLGVDSLSLYIPGLGGSRDILLRSNADGATSALTNGSSSGPMGPARGDQFGKRGIILIGHESANPSPNETLRVLQIVPCDRQAESWQLPDTLSAKRLICMGVATNPNASAQAVRRHTLAAGAAGIYPKRQKQAHQKENAENGSDAENANSGPVTEARNIESPVTGSAAPDCSELKATTGSLMIKFKQVIELAESIYAATKQGIEAIVAGKTINNRLILSEIEPPKCATCQMLYVENADSGETTDNASAFQIQGEAPNRPRVPEGYRPSCCHCCPAPLWNEVHAALKGDASLDWGCSFLNSNDSNSSKSALIERHRSQIEAHTEALQNWTERAIGAITESDLTSLRIKARDFLENHNIASSSLDPWSEVLSLSKDSTGKVDRAAQLSRNLQACSENIEWFRDTPIERSRLRFTIVIAPKEETPNRYRINTARSAPNWPILQRSLEKDWDHATGKPTRALLNHSLSQHIKESKKKRKKPTI